MIRRPPRSTLFPYNDALPISFRACASPDRAPADASSCATAASRHGQRLPRAAPPPSRRPRPSRSEEHTSELQSLAYLVCRLLLEKKKRPYNVDLHSLRHTSLP